MTLQDIRKEVEGAFKFALKKKNRQRKFVYARAVYFKLSRELCPYESLERIGSTLDLNHCTVIHSINNIFPTIKEYEKSFYDVYSLVKKSLLLKYGDGDFDSTKINTSDFLGVQKEFYNELSRSEDRYSELQKKYEEISSKYDLLISRQNSEELSDVLNFVRRVPSSKYSIFLTRLDAMTKMISI